MTTDQDSRDSEGEGVEGRIWQTQIRSRCSCAYSTVANDTS